MKAPATPTAPSASTAIPDEAAVKKVSAGLGAADQKTFRRIVFLVTEHLGSPEAARLWLATPGQEFGTTPLAAIEAGKAHLVLAALQSRWGPSPDYA